MAVLERFTVRAIYGQIKKQFDGGWPLIPPAVCIFSPRDTHGFIKAVQLIIDATHNRSWFRHNPRFIDHITFYARLYRAALECICERHNGTEVSRLLLSIDPFNCDDLCEMDSAMTMSGIYL